MSDYACVSEEQKELVEETVRNAGIHFEKYRFLFDSGEWFDSGLLAERRIEDADIVQRSYKQCGNHNCWALVDDYFTCCGKILSLGELREDEPFDIKKNNVLNVTRVRERGEDIQKLVNDFNNKYLTDFPEMCRYCKPVQRKIPAAIQMTAEERIAAGEFRKGL